MSQVAIKQEAGFFYEAFRGYFSGVLSWEDLDQLWNTLKQQANDQWYIYAVGETPPQQAASKQQLLQFIDAIDGLLHKEHEEDYCGIVYVDDKRHPQFIKIFDPNNLGVVCGYSDNPPLPGWVLSTIRPEPLEELRPLPGNRKRWWARLWQH